jgi:hypothetical protein
MKLRIIPFTNKMSKKKLGYKTNSSLMIKFKNQKLLNNRAPQQQGYRYAKESRLPWRGNSFWGYGKNDLKGKTVRENWTKKCGIILNEEYAITWYLKKWVPKMRLCPYGDQLIRGSCAGVKDSCNAVTRGCTKIHVCTSYSENTKVKRIRDSAIRIKNAVNLVKQKTRGLTRNTFKKAMLPSRYCKKNFWCIKLKGFFSRAMFFGFMNELVMRNVHNSIAILLKNGCIYNSVRNGTFLAGKIGFSLMRNPKKHYVYCEKCVKDCIYLSEHKGPLYSINIKRASVSGKSRLLQEEKKGENKKGDLWGISLYTND